MTEDQQKMQDLLLARAIREYPVGAVVEMIDRKGDIYGSCEVIRTP